MRPIILLFLLVFLSLSVRAQIDSKNKSFSIPATETPKATPDVKPILPKADNNTNSSFGLNIPKTPINLEFDKKELSMFQRKNLEIQENFTWIRLINLWMMLD